MSAGKIAESVVLQLPLRLALGGLFCLAAFKKIVDPQSFAEAIKGFKIVDTDTMGHLIVSAAYTIPWVEMAAGVLLIVGLWTRAAALALGLATASFLAALLSVILRGIDTHCSCFGDMNLFCGETVGWCQVARNTILLIPAGYLVCRGGGVLALDTLVDRRASRAADHWAPDPESVEGRAQAATIRFDSAPGGTVDPEKDPA